MLIARGFRHIAPLLGFIEVIIWITVIANVMRNLNNPLCYVAYAAGFAMGTWAGMRIEARMAMGKQVVRIITARSAARLIRALRAADFGVTNIDAHGARGKVSLIFTVINRADIERVRELIHANNPRAFYSVEDIRFASEGVFPENPVRQGAGFWLHSLLLKRK